MEKTKIDRQSIVRRGDLIIDPQCFTVMLDNEEIGLCPKEFEALLLLAEHPGWVFTKKQLYKVVYGEEDAVNIDNIIYCVMYGLRKKLKSNSRYPQFIRTIKGIGYKFIIPEE